MRLIFIFIFYTRYVLLAVFIPISAIYFMLKELVDMEGINPSAQRAKSGYILFPMWDY